MKTSILCLIGGICVLYFGAVVYAISRGSDVRASLKLPFAAFSFETKRRSDGPAQNK